MNISKQTTVIGLCAAPLLGLTVAATLFAQGGREISHHPVAADSPARLRVEKACRLENDARAAWYDDLNGPKAEAFLLQAIALGGNPDSQEKLLAHIYEAEGRHKEALAVYRKLLSNPLASRTLLGSDTQMQVAKLAGSLGSAAEAEASYVRYVERVVEGATGARVRLSFNSPRELGDAVAIARVAEDNSVGRDASRLESQVSAHPDCAVGHLLLAQAFLNRGKPEAAEKEIGLVSDADGTGLSVAARKLTGDVKARGH